MIVSGIHSLRAYQKCIDTKDLSLQDCINICQVEDAIRMQVQKCRPESVNSIQSAQTMIPVRRFNMVPNSLQTSTDTSLHETAIIVEHQTGPGNTLRYARPKTLHVVNAGCQLDFVKK